MSDKILEIKSFRDNNESSPEVVEFLEQALAMAKDGGVNSIAILAICDNGAVLDCWHKGCSSYEMLGALDCLKMDFFNQNIEVKR